MADSTYQPATEQDVFAAFNFEPKKPDVVPPADGGTPPAGAPPSAPPADGTPPATDPGATKPGGGDEGGDDLKAKAEADAASAAKAQEESKASQRFAEMRVQIKNYESLMGEIATVLGVTDVKDSEAVRLALQDKVLQAQAKSTGVPEEILRQNKVNAERLNQLESRDIEAEAYAGFQKVKDHYKLSDKDISEFAAQLRNVNKNPFASRMDLLTEYRNMNHEAIIKKATDEAIKAEQARADKANNHSTAPNTKQGGDGGSTSQVNTVKDLDALLAKM